MQDAAREIVFLGADHGEEDVEFRGRACTVGQQYGRSLPRDKALSPEPLPVTGERRRGARRQAARSSRSDAVRPGEIYRRLSIKPGTPRCRYSAT